MAKSRIDNRFIAFVDILGFSSLVERMRQEPRLFSTVRDALRVILEIPSRTFRSEKLDLLVGIQLLLVADPKKATLAAMIDNALVQGYTYEAQVVLPQKRSLDPVVFGGSITSEKDWPLKKPDSVDWSSAKIAFLAPLPDRNTVRPSYLVDQSLGVPPSQPEVRCGP